MNFSTDYAPYLVTPDTGIRDVLDCIGKNGKGMVLLVTEGGELITTITDGDIRRSILAEVPLAGRAADILKHKRLQGNVEPVTAVETDSPAEMLARMDEHTVLHLPVVDGCQLRGVVFRSDLSAALRVPVNPVGAESSDGASSGPPLEKIEAVLMAGGFGKRLMPLTKNVPKPMLPVAGRPILERILEQVRDAGVQSFHFTTHFLPEVISDHFGDGSNWGVTVHYVHEEEPRGTGGALGQIEVDAEKDVLLMNGDLLTRVDLRKLVDFHVAEGADLTVGVRQFDMEVPYGVVRCDGAAVEAVEEKPMVPFLVNAGVYVVSGRAREIVPRTGRYDMTDLISDLVEKGSKVSAFPIIEYWMDIGQMQDYRRAEKDQDGWDNVTNP